MKIGFTGHQNIGSSAGLVCSSAFLIWDLALTIEVRLEARFLNHHIFTKSSCLLIDYLHLMREIFFAL